MPFLCIRCKSDIDPKFKACPFCGEAVTEFIRLHHDNPVDGKYKILSCLGAGGMGEVYKVLHVHLNSLRVIKLMRAKIADDPDAHERFVREARMATKIHHPSVATLFDFSTLTDGSRYMVWEYIEGKNLHEIILERGPLSPRHAATIAHEALLGLDAIHRAGIIHRDISPENIMVSVDEDGEEHVKIIDLGIAKEWGEEKQQTSTGVFVGKWKYCSPEHLGVMARGNRIDARADLYSFGIVLYEMLTGVAPFQATTPHGFLVMHAHDAPPALREMNPTVTASPELEAVIFRSLEKDRDQRFASAREFARALQPLIAGLDDTAGLPPKPRVIEFTEDLTVPVGDIPIAEEFEEEDEPQRTVASMGQHRSAASLSTIDAALPEPAAPTVRMNLAEMGPRRHRGAMLASLAAVLILISGGIALSSRRNASPPVTQAAAVPSLPPVPAQAKSRLGLNAYPWGEVRVIRNAKTGQALNLAAPLITPSPIDLEPGAWEVQFSNPEFKKPITRLVELGPGEEQTISVQFSDPTRANLPRFQGGSH